MEGLKNENTFAYVKRETWSVRVHAMLVKTRVKRRNEETVAESLADRMQRE